MHVSVLLNESIENLSIKEDGIYVDCTLGFAGHSKEILKRIKKGKLFAFDQDGEAIDYSKKILDQTNGNYEIIKSNFVNIKQELNKRGIFKVDGILFDLGVSSVQLDSAERGFSYRKNAKLDMRMDKNSSLSAYDVVNNYSISELSRIFFNYGEEKNILENSEIFQAIRIEVNKELDVLDSALEDAIDLLGSNGRLCVITFHSLEDRICKNKFKKYSEVDDIFRGLPDNDIPSEYKPKIKIIKKIKPSKEEIENNNRSRSSILRVIEKI